MAGSWAHAFLPAAVMPLGIGDIHVCMQLLEFRERALIGEAAGLGHIALGSVLKLPQMFFGSDFAVQDIRPQMVDAVPVSVKRLLLLVPPNSAVPVGGLGGAK